jgi:TRAP-type C4-dicarboxylate transport system substrate-binding protein
MRTTARVRRVVAAGAGVALAASLVACTELPEDATRSGDAPPRVLTMGTNDPEGRPSSLQVVEFARLVESLSGGSLRIEPRYTAAGRDIDNWDQAVAGMVMEGDVDLGMIPARAWDTEGVTTLRALHAPLLVTSDAHMDAVVRDDGLAGELLAGLEEVGVTGLGLVPEAIRHLLVSDGESSEGSAVELLAAGGEVRAPWSETTWAFFEALGARPTDAEFAPGMVAAESQLSLVGTLGAADAVVGNLPLFPKVNTVVVNSDVLAGLSGEQQGWLREAAAATRDWAVDERQPDSDLAAGLCHAGTTVVSDPSADSPAVRRAAAEVTAGLRADPGTADLIDRIEALRPAEAALALPRCAAGTGDESIVPTGGDLPDGVYRVEFTDTYLEDQGLSPEMVGHNHGVWTITLQGGRFGVDQVASDFTDRFEGTYAARGNELSWLPYPDEPPLRVTWRVASDGSLEFPRILSGPPDAAFHWGRPWKRVGDAPAAEDVEVTGETIRPDGGDLPDGTYRVGFSVAYLVDHGLTPDNASNNHGTWTTVLDDGRWTVEQVAPDLTDRFSGIYQVEGDDLWWRFHDTLEVIRLRWSVTDAGDLTFEEVPEPAVPDFQFDKAWKRID